MKRIGCGAKDVKELTPDSVKTILDSDRKGDFILLDVRQPKEYKAGHIPGAILIPLGELEARQDELDRSKKIITYCRAGHRSNAAAVELCRLGFKDIYHMQGGIIAWSYMTISGIPPKTEVAETAGIKDILILAMKLEKGSGSFYRLAIDKTASSRAKAMLKRWQRLKASTWQSFISKLSACSAHQHCHHWRSSKKNSK